MPNMWWPAVLDRLVELGRLEPNWDGDGAEPLSFSAANRAAGFLAAIALGFEEIPAPFIAPIHSGVQIEWDGSTWAVEIELRRDESRLLIESSDGAFTFDGKLIDGLPVLYATIGQYAEASEVFGVVLNALEDRVTAMVQA